MAKGGARGARSKSERGAVGRGEAAEGTGGRAGWFRQGRGGEVRAWAKKAACCSGDSSAQPRLSRSAARAETCRRSHVRARARGSTKAALGGAHWAGETTRTTARGCRRRGLRAARVCGGGLSGSARLGADVAGRGGLAADGVLEAEGAESCPVFGLEPRPERRQPQAQGGRWGQRVRLSWRGGRLPFGVGVALHGPVL